MPLTDMPDFAGIILDDFATRNAMRVDTPVILAAEPFLDMAGEDLRRRIFLTENERGTSLCLRPEFTIPVCLRHIETATGTPKRYSYLGQVFRQRREGANEFYQAGIEDLGEKDAASADARIVADALGCLQKVLPDKAFAVTIGDQAVFEAVVAALGLPAGWQRRLVRAFGQTDLLEAMIARLAKAQPVAGLSPEVELLLEAGDEAGLVAHLTNEMDRTGYLTNASRSPEEIVRRLKEKRHLAGVSLDATKLDALKEFLSINVSLRYAPGVLADFAKSANLPLEKAIEGFDARVAALGKAGASLADITWRAAFGRPLDYYTGLVFEITVRGGHDVLVGGGRYDRMLTLLGAKDHIPAVGFSMWLDRIERSLEGASTRKVEAGFRAESTRKRGELR
ncbi:ATP phosphoribosyltransferase regulatory subunit [Rhizobium sp. Root149]|uniref:ATP phosphoribosyltransferase regulatory subunit n=1 Tax=Rhizobium rhizoryzae TaxID=451876 RepID=A0A7W6LHG2_9HYPH|nr:MULTISPECIES: ATP phosphoribosyltransferase regulatory subunit [Rhizobium]KQZ63387.1 ATP phosphoribosyltransferase regulatory subunit [Rhizobium sp. Root149]MBB4143081.1 ATP phosphoribosyltransferase regulatory subunit [Rhizobium rhizoryzae]